MPTLLIKYWREIGFVAIFIAASLFFGLWRYSVLSHKQTKAELELADQAIRQHLENIELAERINHDYQSNIDRLNADIKRLRSHPPRCLTITGPSAVHSESGQGGEHGGKDGISSGWLYEYAFEAEQIRIERNSCKDFVNGIYENRE